MNMLDQLKLLHDAIKKADPEELREWVESVPPEVAKAYATLEQWIRKETPKESEEELFVVSRGQIRTIATAARDHGMYWTAESKDSVVQAYNDCLSRPVEECLAAGLTCFLPKEKEDETIKR